MKKLFRKIHLWLSVPFGIFITLICFSGSMLVFEKEITELCCPDLYFVNEVKEKPLPLAKLMEAVSATLPDSVTATGVTISPDAKRTYQVSLSKPRRASLYVDQYTGEIKGRSERLPFFDTMFHLHRWLMGASQSKDGGLSVGKFLVGTSTLMLVIILVTGILMWLTNKHKPLAKSLTISFTKGWPRFWHDLHVAGGIYATIFLLALALTGLTWSFSWYRNGFYGMFGVEASAGAHGGGATREENAQKEHSREARPEGKKRHNDGETSAVADTTRHEGAQGRHRRGGRRAASTDTLGARSYHASQDSVPRRTRHHSPFAQWQEVYEGLAQAHPGYRQITISDGSASVVPAGRNSLRSGDRFDFDARTGNITGSQPYSDQDKSAKVRSAVYTVHVGSWGGILTRILTFLSALLGATLPLTGYYLWIKRLIRKSAHKHPEA